MNLSNNDLLVLSKSAVTAALQAGKIIRRYAQYPVAVQYKKGGISQASQVVTEVDFLSQEVILKILVPLCKKWDIALLTEESEDDQTRLEKDYFWCIDPLDGTLPFIEATSGYAVSIALLSRSGIPVIGVIYDPVKQILYHAIKGFGVFRNNKLWALTSSLACTNNSLIPLTIVSDRSFLDYDYYTKVMAEFNFIATDLGYASLKTIEHGGAAMNACWVLENNPACYFKFPRQDKGGGSLWDYAASACIFHEIGSVAMDIYGESLELNRPESTFMNHKGIIYAANQDIAQAVIELYNTLFIVKT